LSISLQVVEKAVEFFSEHAGSFCVVTPAGIRLRERDEP
jgi:hypothetical protein